jgi:hypothetical protein
MEGASGDGSEDDGDGDDSDAIWRIFGDEVVLTTVECLDEGGDNSITRYIDLLVGVASEGWDENDDDGDAESIATTDTHSTSPQPTAMPILSRMQPDLHGQGRVEGRRYPLSCRYLRHWLPAIRRGRSPCNHRLQKAN